MGFLLGLWASSWASGPPLGPLGLLWGLSASSGPLAPTLAPKLALSLPKCQISPNWAQIALNPKKTAKSSKIVQNRSKSFFLIIFNIFLNFHYFFIFFIIFFFYFLLFFMIFYYFWWFLLFLIFSEQFPNKFRTIPNNSEQIPNKFWTKKATPIAVLLHFRTNSEQIPNKFRTIPNNSEQQKIKNITEIQKFTKKLFFWLKLYFFMIFNKKNYLFIKTLFF